MTVFLLITLVLVLSTKSMAAPTEGMAAAPTESMAAAPTVLYEDSQFNELRLALQWPASYCRTRNVICNNIPHYFTVHGLWLNDNSCPVNCPSPNRCHIWVNYAQMRRYLNRHYPGWENYWPNLNSRRDELYLWKHEYELHGCCFRRFTEPRLYFQTALDIYHFTARNIATIIENSMNIVPGFYHVDRFKYVHLSGRTFTVGLRCNYGSMGAVPQLLEIVICTDPNKVLKNCSYVDTCNAQWADSRYPKVGTGWFYIPVGAVRSSSPPDRDPVPCNSRHPPHQPCIPVA